ncbi:hypothetical protein [Sandaracinobacteroides saxicola]|uniref:O-antigen/teichoic acid export membrane protein n=1 Tax=Sandaracinobacteroides saxicola TaxID=2759707 RepID=A0A7G5IKJ7_9SPHN|nr:hypothetical protein [Sandaracinobacteroides saxicola]QMW23889.1 hypothetical protein H3309_05295 [Sandaracinobacteroides saxicola]
MSAFARAFRVGALGRLGAAIDIGAVPLLVWLYGLEIYAGYAIAAAALTLGLGSLDLGMSAAVQRFVPRLTAPRRLVGWALGIGVLPALLLGAAGAVLAPTPIWAVVGLLLPVVVAGDLLGAVLRAKQDFTGDVMLRLFAEPGLRVGLAVAALLLAPATALTLLLAHGGAAVAVVLLLLARLRRQMGPAGERVAVVPLLAPLLGRGLALAPGALLRRALADGPPLLMAVMVPAGAAGAAALFLFARKLASVPQLLRTVIAAVMPSVAAAAETGARLALLDEARRTALRLGLPLGLLMLALLPLLARGALAGAVVPGVLLIGARTVEAVLSPHAALVEVLAPPRVPLAISGVGVLLAGGMLVLLPLAVPADAFAAAVSVAVAAGALLSAIAAHRLLPGATLLPGGRGGGTARAS